MKLIFSVSIQVTKYMKTDYYTVYIALHDIDIKVCQKREIEKKCISNFVKFNEKNSINMYLYKSTTLQPNVLYTIFFLFLNADA